MKERARVVSEEMLADLWQSGELGRAWAEAAAALPTFGARVEYVQWDSPGYRAAASWITDWFYGDGPTPAAALRALAARLRERAE